MYIRHCWSKKRTKLFENLISNNRFILMESIRKFYIKISNSRINSFESIRIFLPVITWFSHISFMTASRIAKTSKCKRQSEISNRFYQVLLYFSCFSVRFFSSDKAFHPCRSLRQPHQAYRVLLFRSCIFRMETIRSIRCMATAVKCQSERSVNRSLL